MNEQALKVRLKYIAQETSKSFHEIWKLLILERFLARLSRSEFASKLIFKSGLLLSYYLILGRETIDIDLLGKRLKGEKSEIDRILQGICALILGDGFQMQLASLQDLDHQHMHYPGFRAKQTSLKI